MTECVELDSAFVTVKFLVLDLCELTPPVGVKHQDTVHTLTNPSADHYRNLHQLVGHDCLWWMRRVMDDHKLKETLSRDHLHVVEFCENQDLIGFVELDLSGLPRVNINYFGLVPEHRGRGLGSQLLKWTLAECAAKGGRYVGLTTSSADHPAALKLYLSLGFQQVFENHQVWPIPRSLGMVIPPHLRG
jgi:ribosomal protein S18 acetylase RimI-like enzyme